MKNISYAKFKKAGDKAEGVFGGFEIVPERKEGKKTYEAGMNIVLETKTEIVKFTVSAVLKSKIKNILSALKEGKSKIKVVYKGKPKGKTYKDFDLFHNGKLVEGSGMREKAKKEQIAEFFA